jgi:VWFA-related protein
MQKRRSPYFVYIVATLVLCLFSNHAVPQSKEKPKLKDFGSSLKRIKWDPAQNRGVETKRKHSASQNSDGEDVLRIETSLVISDVIVLDRQGRSVQGLTSRDFIVTEDGRTQPVQMFSLGDNAAVARSIVLIIDYSCSQLHFIKASIEAAKSLVDKLAPGDRMAIVTDDIELLADYTDNKKKLKGKLDDLILRTGFVRDIFTERRPVPFGRGFQYSALMAVLKEAFDDEDVRPIIIFQTDGVEAHILRNPIALSPIPPGLPADLNTELQDYMKRFQKYQLRNPRDFSLDDVFKAAETSRATIYTVVPGFRLVGLSAEEQLAQTRANLERAISISSWLSARNRERLKQVPNEALRWEAGDRMKLQSALAVLSTITGGWIEFFDEPSQADEIYSRIFSDINRRYIVGYYPTNKEHDGKRRKISIAVRDHPEYVVIGRKAYYAPGPAN